MADNKKHHYVPCFYLKHFSTNSDERFISICNLKGEQPQFYSKGDLGNQCYKKYFYGKNTRIENALGKIEGATASIIKDKIIGMESLPQKSDPDYEVILFFVFMQLVRTKYVADETAETIVEMLKELMRIELQEEPEITDEMINEFFTESIKKNQPIIYSKIIQQILS